MSELSVEPYPELMQVAAVTEATEFDVPDIGFPDASHDGGVSTRDADDDVLIGEFRDNAGFGALAEADEVGGVVNADLAKLDSVYFGSDDEADTNPADSVVEAISGDNGDLDTRAKDDEAVPATTADMLEQATDAQLADARQQVDAAFARSSAAEAGGDDPVVEDDEEPGHLENLDDRAIDMAAEGGQTRSITDDDRHSFLSAFADTVEARDPDTAAQIRAFRDSAGWHEQESERDATSESRGSDSFDLHKDAVQDTARVLAKRGTEDGSGTQKRADMCGSMEDLTGVQDPHGMIGGLFHDLAVSFLPWGALLKTDYDKACDAWLEAHMGSDY